MKRIALVVAALLALGVAAVGPVGAQSLTGTITGKVIDEQGGVLPGVAVTLTGKRGSQTTVTDGQGVYRFVGLEPGNYDVQTELAGFTPRTERNLDLGISKTLEVNFTLRVGGLTENVEVVANASSIDVTSAATDNTLSKDLLANMPINLGTFNTAVQIMDYAPGINDGSAFGSDEDYSSALMIDGVDTRDPQGGSAWVFFNYNIVDEIQVQGLGAQAEYGGFTGAVVNTITKSGGNLYSGLFEIRHTNDGLAGDNISQEYIDANPSLADPSVVTKLNDYTVQLGGPLKKDKIFWWGSVQRFAFERDPAGPLSLSTEVSPRYNGKVTFQLTPSDTLTANFQWDNYNVTGRSGKPPVDVVQDHQTVEQDSPEAVYNAQYRKVFNSSTFLEAKYNGWWGYYYLDPVDPTPSRLDLGTGEYAGGGGYFGYYDRTRNQVNVSLSKFAQKYGSHNFKFGVEIERSKIRDRYGYSSDIYFLDYYGAPYLAYSYQYDIEGRNKRESYYAQDSWKTGRLTVNLGLRLDHIRGATEDGDTVYTPDLAWGPRVGGVVDLTGNGTSVLKATWGRYFEGASVAPYYGAVPGRSDYVTYEVLPGDELVEIDRIPELVYGIDDNIKHFRLDEATVGFEQQIRRGLRFSVTGIWRKYDDFINQLIPRATWAPFVFESPLTGSPLTLYEWTNRETTDEDRFITNVSGFQYRDANGNVLGVADPQRDYKGLMLVLSKSYADRWQGQFSYVWSESKGNVNNDVSGPFGTVQFETPNGALVNADGFMENDRTHEFKLLGGYQIPKVEVTVNAIYRAINGSRYTPVRRLAGSTFNFYTVLDINLDERGAEKNDFVNLVDLRLEKTFKVDVHNFGVFLDVANLFNSDVVTLRQTRVPDRTILGFPVAYGEPTTITPARQVTFGGRWSF